MAQKTVYQSLANEIGVEKTLITYEYFPGFSLSQKQKCVNSLHAAASKQNIISILEVSSKSPIDAGVFLSAFNLLMKINNKTYSVEQIFQSSKVFEKGGPYTDLLEVSSKEAKTDIRLKESGSVISFNFFGTDFPLLPKTFFYDWLYSNALLQNKTLLNEALKYNAYTDILFNEKKSINCQAYSLALFCSLIRNSPHFLNENHIEPEIFLKLCSNEYQKRESSCINTGH